jgi:hypothetical protein
MAKDAVATMGTILTADVGGRDAVHVAVIAATAAGKLAPSQHVGFKSGAAPEPVDTTEPIVGASDDPIGIVDPFLEGMVEKGQRFWLYLYPRTITSLRHNWTHPRFEDLKQGQIYSRPTQVAESEAWLKAWCETHDCPEWPTVRAVIEGDESEHRQWSDEYLHFDGRDAHGEIPPSFWHHVEIVLGRKVENKPTGFSCSC